MRKGGYVYIMANRYRGTTYIGVTAYLPHRVMHIGMTMAPSIAANMG